ncbi:unnamed protein product [Symbiodinium sp. CCMP2456]|nr:unnamed protein product [Symbiodinium sp. CCMP2456]
MFRRSSSGAADAADETKPEVGAKGASFSESHQVSLAGDFRILPPSAWQTLHARFHTTQIEQDAFVAGPGQEQASQELENNVLELLRSLLLPAAGQGLNELRWHTNQHKEQQQQQQQQQASTTTATTVSAAVTSLVLRCLFLRCFQLLWHGSWIRSSPKLSQESDNNQGCLRLRLCCLSSSLVRWVRSCRGHPGGSAAWLAVPGRGCKESSAAAAAKQQTKKIFKLEESADGSEMLESQAASLSGDFRMLPPSAWEALHARFCPTKLEQEADAAATSPVSNNETATDMPVETTSQASESQDPDAKLNYASSNCNIARALTEAPPSPESDWLDDVVLGVPTAQCEAALPKETSEFITAPTDAASEIPHAEDADASTEAAPSPASDWWLAFCVAVQQNLCCARVR